MFPPPQSTPSVQSRNKADNRRNWVKVEQYLTQAEKVYGFAKSWEMRERLERGDVRLGDLGRF